MSFEEKMEPTVRTNWHPLLENVEKDHVLLSNGKACRIAKATEHSVEKMRNSAAKKVLHPPVSYGK